MEIEPGLYVMEKVNIFFQGDDNKDKISFDVGVDIASVPNDGDVWKNPRTGEVLKLRFMHVAEDPWWGIPVHVFCAWDNTPLFTIDIK